MSDAPTCRCGAKLGRSGKCPALCEDLPAVAPAYIGPAVVGKTHIGRIGTKGNGE